MSLSLKIRAASLVAVVLLLAVVTLASAAVSPARAETRNFWDDEPNKPSVTGRATSRRHAARLTSRDDDDAPVRHRSSRNKRRIDDRAALADAPERKANRRKTRVASLGGDGDDPRPSRKSLSGGGHVTWAASSGCLNGTLIGLVQEVASAYGPLTVSSTCRDRGHNAAVGGARHSQHLTGDAVDFRVHGNASGAMAFLRNHGSVGGFHHYGGGLFHIDTGPHRTW